jgi:enoyl-CoA hydratase
MTIQTAFPPGLSVSTDDGVATVQLERPQSLNALSRRLIGELTQALDALDADPAIKALVLCGAGSHFCAGADIREMVTMSPQDVLASGYAGACVRLAEMRKPVIAAVSGHAIGGGFELVQMCDIVVAADTARFGHPEVSVGTMPGAGGTQRLPRIVGRHLALDLLLTGRLMTAAEALAYGLVSRVVSPANVQAEAQSIAHHVASLSAPVVALIKEAVNHADRASLADGLAFERRLFALTFALEDRSEGMSAFIEKRPPRFSDS